MNKTQVKPKKNTSTLVHKGDISKSSPIKKKKTEIDTDTVPKKKSFFKAKKESSSEAKIKARVGGRLEITVGNLSANLNVMINAAHRAGLGLAYDFDEIAGLKVSKKTDNSFVSEADIVSEKTIITILDKAKNKTKPEFGFVSEENTAKSEKDSAKKFIIDPLDGTANFLHGIPAFSVSIAMVINNEVIAGVVYDPITDETFFAEKGGGAYILSRGISRRIRVSDNSKLSECIANFEIPDNMPAWHNDCLNKQAKIMSEFGGIRRVGSTALAMAYVAAGRFDGCIAKGIKAWDIAAGILLVKEAGGYVCNYHEEEKDNILLEKDSIIASNNNIKTNFKKLLLK